MIDLSQPQEFRPLPGSRRGEATAWFLAVLTMLAATFAAQRGYELGFGVYLLAGFFALAGLLISFGNWVERRTVLGLEADGVRFQNGLRKVRLSWREVQRVQVFPGPRGDKVLVWGEEARFAFQTGGELKWAGEVREQTGFAEGEAILKTIVRATNLQLHAQAPDEAYYYARE